MSESGDQPETHTDEPSTSPTDAAATSETTLDEQAAPTTTPDAVGRSDSATDKHDNTATAKDNARETEEASATGDPTTAPEPESPPAIPAADSEPPIADSPVTDDTGADATATATATATEADATAALVTDETERSTAATAMAEKPRGFEALFTWVQRTFFNRTPTVSFDPASLIRHADGSITGAVIGKDADGDVLTYTAAQPVGGGAVTIRDNGSFVYMPTPGVADGSEVRFSVTASDHSIVNGWHVHGLLGFLVAGYGSAASTTVGLGASTGSTAGGRYGWGTPRETRFTSVQALSAGGWTIYNSLGHHGFGRRTPNAISFVNGTMVITGDAAGNTGGLTWSGGQKYGAWEVRARVPQGATDYHAVALLWPDAENWPVGGEVDFVEVVADGTRQNVSHFLHYSALNRTERAVTAVDATQWHNYAVSWTPQAITVYIDANPVFRTTDTSHFPPGPMHLALQLDASETRPLNLSAGGQMAVAWARQYTLGQIT